MTGEELKNIIVGRLEEVGENTDFYMGRFLFGTFESKPNMTGVFQINDKWFFYQTDERNEQLITGPFDDEDIVFVVAVMIHKSKYFDDFKFSEKTEDTLLDVHYRSLDEAEASLKTK